MTALTIHPSTKSTYSIMSAARKRTLSVKIVFLCALMFLDVLVALSPERKPIPPIQKTRSLREQSAVTIQQRTVF